MITVTSLIYFLIAALVLWLVYYVVIKFIPAQFHVVVGIICGIVLLLIGLGIFTGHPIVVK